MRLPAAAVQKDAVILRSVPEDAPARTWRVARVENSTPVPGRILWTLSGAMGEEVVEIGGAEDVDVVSV